MFPASLPPAPPPCPPTSFNHPHRPRHCMQDLRRDVLAMVSEDEEEDDDDRKYGSDPGSSAEFQRRLWEAEPAQRDDVLPFFVWSIVHDPRRSEIALRAFLDVRKTFGKNDRIG